MLCVPPFSVNLHLKVFALHINNTYLFATPQTGPYALCLWVKHLCLHLIPLPGAVDVELVTVKLDVSGLHE